MFDPDALRLLLVNPSATLDHAMALLAEVDPDAPEVSGTTSELDKLANGGEISSPDQLLSYVHGTLGFTGDGKRYYSPDNSLIHKVIERRRGNPLSLAVIASEVGRRNGVNVLPVGMPGHVLLTDSAGNWFDPFGGGHPLDETACRKMFERYASQETFSTNVLAPMTLSAIVSRTLANLFNAYGRLGDLNQLVKVAKLRLVVAPGSDAHNRVFRLLEMAGRFEEAADSLEQAHALGIPLVGSEPAEEHDEDTELTQTLQRLRAHRN